MNDLLGAILNIWIEDILPMIYVVIAVDALVRNVRSLKNDIVTPRHKALIVLGTALCFLFAVLYLMVIFQLDHAINPNPADFSALYVRPLMGLTIVYFWLLSKNRQSYLTKEGSHDDSDSGSHPSSR